MARLGSRSKPEGLGRYRVLRPAGQGILSQVEAESLTIAELIKVAETYALLAVAEALQFSLGQDWPAGPLLTQVPPCSIGRPTVSTRAATHPGLRTPNLSPPPSPPTPS